ncbi:metallopeptidase family protein [Tessaracoccus terricola]
MHRSLCQILALSPKSSPGTSVRAMDLPEERFDELVDEALGNLPPELLDGLDNVVIVTQDEPEDGSDTLGWYEGTALTDRDTSYGMGQLPDRVVLFRGPLTRMCEDEDDLLDELEITLLHELGHYHGIDEERLHELGWG